MTKIPPKVLVEGSATASLIWKRSHQGSVPTKVSVPRSYETQPVVSSDHRELFQAPAWNPDAPVGAAMLSELAWTEIGRSLCLSGRELEIVRGVFDSTTEFAMGAELRVSAHTIHTHSNRLFRKLSVHTRSQLILRVLKEFLLLTTSPDGSLPPICRNRAAGRCSLTS
jgi:DNA-binding CsgD family transcriptional regulator